MKIPCITEGIRADENALTERLEVLSDHFSIIADLVPTRDELLEMAKYWYLEYVCVKYFEYWAEQSEWRKVALAAHRIGQIRRVIGDEAVINAGKQVVKEYGKDMKDRRTWNRFVKEYGLRDGSGLRLGRTDEKGDEDVPL